MCWAEPGRRLAHLRRTRPELTDPAFGSVSCEVDESSRVFVMRRGAVTMAVNFGDSPATVALDAESGLLFATGDGVDLDDRTLSLPAHAGALAAPV